MWGTVMTNQEILNIAMAQSAIDANCESGDFVRGEPVIVESKVNPDARKYLDLPFACNLISYGSNIVASIDMSYRDIVENYIHKYGTYHCFETPQMHVLNEAFREHGMKVCFMAEYFLPDVNLLPDAECGCEMRLLEQKDLEGLYLPQWSNALCEKRKALDMLGCGAYRNGKLVGLAGCSADCGSMWQIGIDVLAEERRKGIASALTASLAKEILRRGKVPFYCCAWSNLASARNAIKSGFRPAWVEMTVKTAEFVDGMNE